MLGQSLGLCHTLGNKALGRKLPQTFCSKIMRGQSETEKFFMLLFTLLHYSVGHLLLDGQESNVGSESIDQ